MRKILFTILSVLVLIMCAGAVVSAKGGTYYYDQLTSREKAYYNVIKKSGLKNGDMKPLLIARSTSEIYGEIEAAVDAYSEDHTEIFWATISYFTEEKAKDGSNEYYLRPVKLYGFHKRNIASDIKTVNKTIKSIVKAASKKKTIYDKLLYVHDWLTTHNTYNTKGTVNGEQFPWTGFSALMSDFKPVCEGYSKAFKMICDEMGIPCVLVSNDSHMWNYVSLNGKWYGMDVTMDDPVVRGGSNSRRSGYEHRKYFLVGKNTKVGSKKFIKSHKPDTWYLNDAFEIPGIESSKYVNIPVKSVTLNIVKATMQQGRTLQLKATISPKRVNDPTLKWKSGNPRVAKVSKNGLVTAVSPGKTKITVITSNNKKKFCTITVKAKKKSKSAGKK